MLVAPGALHQDAARPPVAGLGDRAALDRVAGRTAPTAPCRDRPSARAAFGKRERSPISASNVAAAIRSMPRIAISAVTTSASDQSGTAARIACSSRAMRSCAWRIANSISSKTMRCSGCSSFWLASQPCAPCSTSSCRRIVQALPQQERRDLLALRPQVHHRRLARPREITHRLVTRDPAPTPRSARRRAAASPG